MFKDFVAQHNFIQIEMLLVGLGGKDRLGLYFRCIERKPKRISDDVNIFHIVDIRSGSKEVEPSVVIEKILLTMMTN